MQPYTHHPQADGQIKHINCIIGQILHTKLLDEDHEHWPDYVAVTDMAINSTINGSINKALFYVFNGKNIRLPVDLLLSKESSINPHAYIFVNKTQ